MDVLEQYFIIKKTTKCRYWSSRGESLVKVEFNIKGRPCRLDYYHFAQADFRFQTSRIEYLDGNRIIYEDYLFGGTCHEDIIRELSKDEALEYINEDKLLKELSR